MRLHVQVLSAAEREKVHQVSLRILQETGVHFNGERALPLLDRFGAKIDWENRIARIPAELVEQCLETTPKSFLLGARNTHYDQLLPIGESRYCIDGTAAFTLDFETGKRRYGTLLDIERSLRVFQTLDLGLMAWAPTCASDKPAHSRALHEFFGMARACSKHGQHELHTVAQVPYLVEGLKLILGSEEALKNQKAFSLIYCPVAPLSHDGEMLDAYLELGEFEMPVTTLPMPICGTTGPGSLFGNICLANAENLSSLVVYQLNHPGRPIIMGSATGVVDFLSGAYLGGVPEMGLMSAAITEMAHFYEIPSASAGCTADANFPGPEAVMQKMITTFAPAAANTDIIIGYGEIEGDQLLVLEQLIIDNEIAHYCQRTVQGVDGSEGKDLLEDILQVGPGGHFLKSRNTRNAPRSGEFYINRLIPLNSYEAWKNLGSPTMYQRARERVSAILEGPLIDPIAESTQAQLDELLLRADKALA